MSRHRLIGAALSTLAALRANRWLPAPEDGRGFVLTLHHVRPEPAPRFAPNAGLAVTPDFLDHMIGALKEAGWQFVSVADLLDLPAPHGAKRLALTLDDGYRNNLEHAAPVFRRRETPYTIFVCPGFCDATAELWWEALERIIAGTEIMDPPGARPGAPGSTSLPARSPAEKQAAFMTWRHYLTETLDEAAQRRVIRELAAYHRIDLGALARGLVMSWDEIRQIAADPLCTIGAHTMTHPALARLDRDAALAEMRGSADRIERETGVRPEAIAFPYGYRSAAGPREAALAAEAGFRASFTTRPGLVRAGRRHGLPRISVNGLHQSVAAMEALLGPGLWALKERLAG